MAGLEKFLNLSKLSDKAKCFVILKPICKFCLDKLKDVVCNLVIVLKHKNTTILAEI